ncbi:uncharacterized protein GGS22DRAFT_3513 [Annulohypoxylon maeteangense]|uniref:uncharacterized protein n=1 Tax=Annulohypoxylon maeteangense TaxID=1927788 RepID=UPI0020082543|nr:uncharacterized protein GGS22DRAFT_3513 [Annulohypoxylon maeteangense]KAI0889745.1 hypothetical protein GGS22DRAFT_3513 [Annulohypoxylon maeteangense]
MNSEGGDPWNLTIGKAFNLGSLAGNISPEPAGAHMHLPLIPMCLYDGHLHFFRPQLEPVSPVWARLGAMQVIPQTRRIIDAGKDEETSCYAAPPLGGALKL